MARMTWRDREDVPIAAQMWAWRRKPQVCPFSTDVVMRASSDGLGQEAASRAPKLLSFSLIPIRQNSTWQKRFSNHENLTMSGGLEV
jgi:hypothetical protein